MKTRYTIKTVVGVLLALTFGCVALAALTGCVAQVSEDPTVDPWPCAISSTMVCRECEDQPPGSICGVYGVCSAVAFGTGGHCVQPCDHMANGQTCAPGRHCQQIKELEAAAVCWPDQ